MGFHRSLLVKRGLLRKGCGLGVVVPFLGREATVIRGMLVLCLGGKFRLIFPFWSLF